MIDQRNTHHHHQPHRVRPAVVIPQDNISHKDGSSYNTPISELEMNERTPTMNDSQQRVVVQGGDRSLRVPIPSQVDGTRSMRASMVDESNELSSFDNSRSGMSRSATMHQNIAASPPPRRPELSGSSETLRSDIGPSPMRLGMPRSATMPEDTFSFDKMRPAPLRLPSAGYVPSSQRGHQRISPEYASLAERLLVEPPDIPGRPGFDSAESVSSIPESFSPAPDRFTPSTLVRDEASHPREPTPAISQRPSHPQQSNFTRKKYLSDALSHAHSVPIRPKPPRDKSSPSHLQTMNFLEGPESAKSSVEDLPAQHHSGPAKAPQNEARRDVAPSNLPRPSQKYVRSRGNTNPSTANSSFDSTNSGTGVGLKRAAVPNKVGPRGDTIPSTANSSFDSTNSGTGVGLKRAAVPNKVGPRGDTNPSTANNSFDSTNSGPGVGPKKGVIANKVGGKRVISNRRNNRPYSNRKGSKDSKDSADRVTSLVRSASAGSGDSSGANSTCSSFRNSDTEASVFYNGCEDDGGQDSHLYMTDALPYPGPTLDGGFIFDESAYGNITPAQLEYEMEQIRVQINEEDGPEFYPGGEPIEWIAKFNAKTASTTERSQKSIDGAEGVIESEVQYRVHKPMVEKDINAALFFESRPIAVRHRELQKEIRLLKALHTRINETTICCGGILGPFDFGALEKAVDDMLKFHDTFLKKYIDSGLAAHDYSRAMYKAKADGVKDYTNYKYYEKYLDEPEEEGESRSQRNFFKDTLGNFQHKMKGIFSQAGKKRDFNVANHKHNARELLKKSEETNKWMAEQREKEEAKEKAHLQLRRRQFEFALREVNKICEAEEAAEAAALAEKAEEEAREKAERTAAEARAQYEDDGENQVNLALGSDNLYGAEPEIHQAEEYESQKARSSNSLSSFRTSYYANSEDLETLSKYYEQARLSETDVSRAEYGGGELPEGALRRHHSF